MPLKELTDRQKEIFEYIKDRMENRRSPPTVREIGQNFGINSTNGVRSILTALIKKGYIRKKPKLSRGIDLAESSKSPTPPNIVEIPILGRVAAGSPVLAVENLEGTVTVDRDFILRQPDVFALKVQGDSMKEAGILNGDVLFARHKNTAEKGQIVVALIGEEATVKYFFPESNRIRLEPANSAYRSIIVEEGAPDFRIIGRVIGVMRQYKH